MRGNFVICRLDLSKLLFMDIFKKSGVIKDLPKLAERCSGFGGYQMGKLVHFDGLGIFYFHAYFGFTATVKIINIFIFCYYGFKDLDCCISEHYSAYTGMTFCNGDSLNFILILQNGIMKQ